METRDFAMWRPRGNLIEICKWEPRGDIHAREAAHVVFRFRDPRGFLVELSTWFSGGAYHVVF